VKRVHIIQELLESVAQAVQQAKTHLKVLTLLMTVSVTKGDIFCPVHARNAARERIKRKWEIIFV
tara:strand:+ start:1426 stop:1620 length:195 start_codon:yes stop_codon:yes gene_type:complete